MAVLTLEETKQYLRIDSADEDEFISGLIGTGETLCADVAPLFMFISGYFYKEVGKGQTFGYVKKKVRRLLVPYLLWNLVYGLLAWLLRGHGFSMGEEIGIRTLLLAPFMHGYQFIYNYAAWFVPVLLVIEMMNLLMRLICGWSFEKLSRRRDEGGNLEWFYLAGSLAIGMIVVLFAFSPLSLLRSCVFPVLPASL